MGDLFSLVKEAVTARNAAEFYGIHVNRSGMARCPFHNDRTPSMKLDRRFHCFGCGADGDVIDFAARLFGLGNKAAAEKLASDFGISYGKWKPPDSTEIHKAKVRKDKKRLYEEAERNFYRILTDYYHLMRRWKEKRAPKHPDEGWDGYFCEALRNLDVVGYVLDCFLESGQEERAAIMNSYGRRAALFVQRIRQYQEENQNNEEGEKH